MTSFVSNKFNIRINNSMPSWVTNQPSLFAWAEIPNTRMDVTGSGSGILAYSGAVVYDNVMWVNGGGHTDYSGNEVNKINFKTNTPAWERIGAPTPSGQRPEHSAYYPYDGKPTSRHTYWTIQHSVQHNRVFLVGGYAYGSTLPLLNIKHVDGFNLTTNTWDLPNAGAYWPDMPYYNSAMCIAKDNQERLWLNANQRIYRCDMSTMAWTDLGAARRYAKTETPMAYDSKRNKLFQIVCQYSERAQWIDLNGYTSGMPSSVDAATYVGPHAAKANNYTSMVYCSYRDSFLFTKNNESANQKIYEISDLDNPSKQYYVDELPVSGAAPSAIYPDTTVGNYGRFAYLPELQVIVVVNSVQQNIKFFRIA